ncbi:hypothetical protein B7463_g5108, partial [Scytalidium lignicola]
MPDGKSDLRKTGNGLSSSTLPIVCNAWGSVLKVPESYHHLFLQTTNASHTIRINMSDPFDDFDTNNADKSFLLELLRSGIVPPEEVALFEQTLHESGYQYKPPGKRVEQFTADLLHRITSNIQFIQLEEFKNEVYHYARAVGLGPNRAKLAAMKAEGEWKSEKQLLNGSEFHPSLREMEGCIPIDTAIDDMEQQLALSIGSLGDCGMLPLDNDDANHCEGVLGKDESSNFVSYSIDENSGLVNEGMTMVEVSNTSMKQKKVRKARGFTTSVYFDKVEKSASNSMRSTRAPNESQIESFDSSNDRKEDKHQRKCRSKRLEQESKQDIEMSEVISSTAVSTLEPKSPNPANFQQHTPMNVSPTVSTNILEDISSSQAFETNEMDRTATFEGALLEEENADELVCLSQKWGNIKTMDEKDSEFANDQLNSVKKTAIYQGPEDDTHRTLFKSFPFVGSQEPTNGDTTLAIEKVDKSGLSILEEAKSTAQVVDGNRPQTPKVKCEDVITSPSKIILNACTKAYESIKDISKCLLSGLDENHDSDYSDFSMTKYGSLDWDHSGDDFEEITVSQKPKRNQILLSQRLEWPDIGTSTDDTTSSSLIPKRTLTDSEEQNAKGGFKRIRIRKKLPFKSPYFTPPTSASKEQKVKSRATLPRDVLSEPQEFKEEEDAISGDSPSKCKEMKSPKRGLVSCIPFPPLSSPYFGLIQERLADNPFRLLIAITFLNRTHGKYAIPVFFELMGKYPTPGSLVSAKKDDIIEIIRNLGLQRKRADTYQTYAKMWLENPPTKGKRYAVKDYPLKGDGRNIKPDEVLTDEDERVAWELGHMTQGRYAIDSWRIFCRDVLRGEATSWNGEGSTKENFQPEWMRVLPEDKELRAYLRWMWLKEGFEWDPFTGEKEVASKELMQAAVEGNVAWDDQGGMRMIAPEEREVKSDLLDIHGQAAALNTLS